MSLESVDDDGFVSARGSHKIYFRIDMQPVPWFEKSSGNASRGLKASKRASREAPLEEMIPAAAAAFAAAVSERLLEAI